MVSIHINNPLLVLLCTQSPIAAESLFCVVPKEMLMAGGVSISSPHLDIYHHSNSVLWSHRVSILPHIRTLFSIFSRHNFLCLLNLGIKSAKQTSCILRLTYAFGHNLLSNQEVGGHAGISPTSSRVTIEVYSWSTVHMKRAKRKQR